MKIKTKLTLKHTETNLETDIDDSYPLYPLYRSSSKQTKKTKTKRILKKTSPQTFPEVYQLWFRGSYGSNWSTWAKHCAFLASKRNLWICRSGSPENWTLWYILSHLGSRQRCWHWSRSSRGRDLALLWMASIGHQGPKGQCPQAKLIRALPDLDSLPFLAYLL